MTDAVDQREQVIRAADQLFNAHGVHAVGMDKVRDAAGVSLKKIYSFFPSKEALILAVLDDRTRQWNAGILACAEGLSSPREKLLAVFDFLMKWFDTDEFRGCAFINAYGNSAPRCRRWRRRSAPRRRTSSGTSPASSRSWGLRTVSARSCRSSPRSTDHRRHRRLHPGGRRRTRRRRGSDRSGAAHTGGTKMTRA